MTRTITLILSAALILTACGSDTGIVTRPDISDLAATIHDGACADSTGEQITIFSGRSEDLIGPVLEAFECASGIDTATKYGDPTDLALLLQQEGDRTEADVFISKSPGAVGFLDNEGLLGELDESVLDLVADHNRAADGSWVGLTGRKRVLVYNIDSVEEADLPNSIFDLTDEAYRGRVGIPADNGSFQDWFTVFRATEGEEVAIAWLNDMVANDAIKTESNRPTVDAVGRGEFDFGLVNHYYNFQEALALGDDHRALNHDFAAGDIGSLLIITAAGPTADTEDAESVAELLTFMLDTGAQKYFTEETLEYPLSAGVTPAAALPALDDTTPSFDVNFDNLGDGLARTVEIIEESGINR